MATPAFAARPPAEPPRVQAPSVVAGTLPPIYWSQAYDDLFGFTFWTGNKDQFGTHGFNDVFTGITGPSPGPAQTATMRRSIDLREVNQETAADGCRTGDGDAERAAEALFNPVEQRLQPNPSQRGLLSDLRAALVNAKDRIDSACAGDYATASPPERVKMIANRLATMRQAVLIVRTPLDSAYSSLSDQQKALLNATSVGKLTCTGDMGSAASWPRDQIERAVHLTEQQRPSMEALGGLLAQMGQWLAAQCPRQPLPTIVQRLDAAGDRLNALLYATRMVSRALDGFYAALSDEQRASFQAIGRRGSSRSAALLQGAR